MQARRRWLIAATLLLVVPDALAATPQQPSLRVNPQAWTVKVVGAAAPGSGVVVRSDAAGCLILTAGHVLKGTSLEDQPYVLFADGHKQQILLLHDLKPLDLMELTVPACKAVPATISRAPHLGGPIWVAGYPQESERFWLRSGPSEAQGTSPTSRPGGYAIFHGAPTRVGISGGGVYNAEGELIGIHGEADITTTRSGQSYKSGIGLAIPISFWPGSFGQADQRAQASRPAMAVENDLLQVAWLESMKRQPDALVILDRIISQNPRETRARIRRAAIYMALRRYRDALADYDLLIQDAPADAPLLINRGNALLALGRAQEALATYDQALALKPGLVWGQVNRAKALLSLGRDPDAMASLNAALQLSPADPAALRERAELRIRKGQLSAARSDLDLLLLNQPSNAEALSRRGLVRGELADLRGSVDDLSAAVELQPDEPSHRVNRGVSLARLRLWSDAESDLRQALVKLNDDPRLLANLGEVVFAQGRRQEGCTLARQALARGFSWQEGQWNEDYKKQCQSP